MNRKLRNWIPTIAFWILFAASLALGKHYPWLDTVWYGALVLVLLALSAYSLTYTFRHRHETDSISYQGVPGWLQRFFFDEEDSDSSARADNRKS